MSNILLLQLVDQGSPTRRGGGGGRTNAGQQLLPAPTTGTSNRAAASELDRLTGELRKQFDALQTELSPFSGAAFAVRSLPAATGDISNNLRTLAVEGTIFGSRIQSLGSGLQLGIAGSTARLGVLQA